MSSLQILRQLHTVIGDSLSQIETNFQERSLDWPSLDKPYLDDAADAAASAPASVEASNRIVAAAEQFIASIRGPFYTLCEASMAYHLPACLRFAEQTHVFEIVREAGPQGLHVNDIAEKSNQDALKLGHAMRFLATHHIFREVKPDIFTNNRISSYMDTGKSSTEILSNPEDKYEGTSGVAAWIDVAGDEMFKAAAYMTETYTDPATKHSLLPSQASFQRALNTDKTYFPWLEEPGNIKRLKRFGVAMIGTSQWEAPNAILEGFPWGSLPDNSVMVDVGGGIGSLAMKIAKVHPHIKMVVQDSPTVVAMGESMWRDQYPEALGSGRVKFQAHDFFEPQPCKDASVFLLRAICHDWSDPFVAKILKHLGDAAMPNTKLVLGDFIIPYACVDDTVESNLPGAAKTLAPPPLLANLGRASVIAYSLDMTMQTMFNGQERTLTQVVSILAESGWKVTNVHRVGDSRFGHITAVTN